MLNLSEESHAMLSLSYKPKRRTGCAFVFVITDLTQLKSGKTPHMMDNK